MRIACVGGGPAGPYLALLTKLRDPGAHLSGNKYLWLGTSKVFAALLHGRRSPLLPHLPPHVFYLLHQAIEEVPLLGELRSRVAPMAKTLHSRHNLAQKGTSAVIRQQAKRQG